MNKKIIIFSGGTGGHVLPAINFGNFLIEQDYDCYLILDSRGKKFSENFKGTIFEIDSSHLSGNIFYKIKSILKLLRAFISSLILMIKIHPDKCISFGSYATFTPLLATLIIKIFYKIDIYLHEQNSLIGKVNLFFLPYSKFFFTNFEHLKNLKAKNISKKCYVGLPNDGQKITSKINQILTNKNKIFFVYGGSQGSMSLINKLLLILYNIDIKYLKEIKFVIQSPKKMHKSLSEFFNKNNLDYEIKDFYNNIDEILNQTDFVFTRAGAGTINDIIRYKIPSIILPLSHSINNHQYYNAKYLFDKEASILIEEENFDSNLNSEIFTKLITNEKKQQIMKKALNEINLPEANEIMLTKILL